MLVGLPDTINSLKVREFIESSKVVLIGPVLVLQHLDLLRGLHIH
jgi:hypothetical protein